MEKKYKPFDLEAAKKGKPVCTRDGREARIICFDRMGVYPVVALVQKGGIEMCHFYTTDGKCVEESNYDLMMASEKKEGYVNLYHNSNDRYAGYLGNNVIYRDEEFARKMGKDCPNYIKTIKVEWYE